MTMLAGLWAIVWGAPPLWRGQRVQVDAGTLVALGAIVVAMVVVVALRGRVRDLVKNHPVWAVLGFMAAVNVVPLVPLVGVTLGDVVLGSVPAGPTLGIGIVATAASFVWMVVASRAAKGLDNPLAPSLPRPGTGDRR